jgi:enoyl-CoA hydratase
VKKSRVSSASHRGGRGDAGSVEVSSARGCITATLSRPASDNRISAAMADQLLALFERFEDDPSALMLTVTGAGPVFCAGFEPDVNAGLVESFAALSKPTMAILNGNATDEGLEMAMAADIRLALADARLVLTQPSRGAMPRFGATQRLPRLAGAANALWMLLAGASVDGAEAMRIGLVTYVASNRRRLAERAGEVAQAMLERAPLALQLVKDAVRKGYDMTLDQGIRLEEDLYALLQTTADRCEGVKAFLDKRKPLFKGA